MSGSELKMEVPKEIVASIVKAQVIAALGKSEELIAGVVRSALEQKTDRYSSSPTIFEAEVTRMIREVAVESFQEWLKENREKIRAEMRRQLTEQKGKLLTDLVNGFTNQLTSIYPNVKLNFSGEGR